MTSYHLTERADAELLEIFLQGIDMFGLLQARRYRDELLHCFELIAENPKMGRAAPRLGALVRRHEHKSHIILYRVTPEGIRFLALVPGRSLQRLKLSDD